MSTPKSSQDLIPLSIQKKSLEVQIQHLTQTLQKEQAAHEKNLQQYKDERNAQQQVLDEQFVAIREDIKTLEEKSKTAASDFAIESEVYNSERIEREEQLKTLNNKISDAEKLLKTLYSQQEEVGNTIRDNNDDIIRLSSNRTEIQSSINALKSELAETQLSAHESSITLADIREEITKESAAFEAAKTEHEKEFTMLTARKLESAQKILEEQSSMEIVRDNLATWQHKLEERDANLRTREAKVEQSEKIILRRSNMLNL